jgi:hypothetical protein
MAYNTVPTLVTGDPWSAANANIYWRDNFEAGVPAIINAAGDLVYGTAANAATVLAIGAAKKALKVNSGGTAPTWDDDGDISARQGGSSTDYTTAGTTNYTLTTTQKKQMGAIPVTITTGHTNEFVTLTFPTAFTEKPLVLASVLSSEVTFFALQVYAVTLTTVQFEIAEYAAVGTDHDYVIAWLAIGE